MKIALINSTFAPDVIGGAELSVQFLAESLADSGHEVLVIAMGRESGLDWHKGIRIYRVKLRNLYWPYGERRAMPLRVAWNVLDILNPFMARAAGAILAQEKPDVVHTNNLQGISPLVWKTAYDLNIPVVHTIRDLFLLCPKSVMFRNGRNCDRQCFSCRLFSRPKQLLSRYVSRIVGISRFILDRHVNLGWFPNAERTVIHNSYAPSPYVESTSLSDRIRFGYLGRLDHRKGVELLLSVFSRPDIAEFATLLLGGVGEPAYVDMLRHKAAVHGVTFAGRVDPAQFFAQVDVLVVPSIIHEALGRVIIEAYAHGRPVIAAQRGGIPEIVDPGKTGFLFDPEDEGRLGSMMRRFVEHPALAREMAEGCREAFRQFEPNLVAGQYSRVYESVTARGPGGLGGLKEANATGIKERLC